MEIQAKYPSKCALCGEQIEVFARIWWTKGEPAVHLECHQDEVTNEASPIKPVQAGVVARYKPPVQVQPSRDFECKTCESHPKFDALSTMMDHLKAVHQVDTTVAAKKERLMHADAREFFVDKFQWTFDGGVQIHEETKSPRMRTS